MPCSPVLHWEITAAVLVVSLSVVSGFLLPKWDLVVRESRERKKVTGFMGHSVNAAHVVPLLQYYTHVILHTQVYPKTIHSTSCQDKLTIFLKVDCFENNKSPSLLNINGMKH